MKGAPSKPITAAVLRRWPLPRLEPRLGKVARGRLVVVGGSETNPGAVILAATAALRAGAGTLVIATSHRRAGEVAVAFPEARVVGLRSARSGELAAAGMRSIEHEVSACDTLVLGPGMMDGRAGTAMLHHCARAHAPVTCVVDAAPLAEMLHHKPGPGAPALILTPHPGEMATLCGITSDDVLARPLELARQTARRLGAVIALKGAVTHVVAPDGRAYHSTAGNLGLGTAGSGDVLSGVIGGLCAQGADPLQAAVWGVHLHGCAGDVLARTIGPLGYLARELPAELPALLARLAGNRR